MADCCHRARHLAGPYRPKVRLFVQIGLFRILELENPRGPAHCALLTPAQLFNRTNEDIMSKAQHNQKSVALTTPSAASRVQAAVARSPGGSVAKGSYVGCLQAAAARNYGKSGAK